MPNSSSPSSSLKVDRPNFNVDESDDEIELWSFRLPINFPINSLNGIEIDLNDKNFNKNKRKSAKNKDDDDNGDDSTKPVQISTDEGKYVLKPNKTEGLGSFRALIPREEKKTTKGKKKKGRNDDDDNDLVDSDSSDSDSDDDDDDDDSDDDMEYLHPTSRPFVQHFDVLSDFKHMTEREIAPLKGPEAVDDKQIHAYSKKNVPQRPGLVRRWMPPGVPIPPKNKIINNDNDNDNNNNNNNDNDKKTKTPTTPTTHKSNKKKKRNTSPSSTPASSPTKKRRKGDKDDDEGAPAVEVPGSSSSKKTKKERKEEKKAKKKYK